MAAINEDTLNSLPKHSPFVSFYCVIVVAKTSGTTSSRSGKNEHSTSVLILT